jgi:hypothetical protein
MENYEIEHYNALKSLWIKSGKDEKEFDMWYKYFVYKNL